MNSHAANMEHSLRLKRVAALLGGGGEYSTREIIRRCQVCAVNAIVHELRENGLTIHCRQAQRRGRRVWLYRLDQPSVVETA